MDPKICAMTAGPMSLPPIRSETLMEKSTATNPDQTPTLSSPKMSWKAGVAWTSISTDWLPPVGPHRERTMDLSSAIVNYRRRINYAVSSNE